MRAYLLGLAIVCLEPYGLARTQLGGKEEREANYGTRSGHVLVAGRYLAVGINRYADPGPHVLRGPENDAALVAKFLKGRGLAGETLLGKDATRAALLARLAAASRGLKPTDSFVLYLSGHGTQGEKPAFLPYDFRDKDDRMALSADDLAQALEAFPCAHVTAILDFPFCSAIAHPSAKLAYVAACKANEASLETSFDGKYAGLFTYALLGVLERGSSSWPEVVADTRTSVAKIIASKGSRLRQTPTLFGEPDAALLGGFAPESAPVVLQPGDRVRVAGGEVVPVVAKVTGQATPARPKVVEVALRYLGTPTCGVAATSSEGSTQATSSPPSLLKPGFRRCRRPSPCRSGVAGSCTGNRARRCAAIDGSHWPHPRPPSTSYAPATGSSSSTRRSMVTRAVAIRESILGTTAAPQATSTMRSYMPVAMG